MRSLQKTGLWQDSHKLSSITCIIICTINLFPWLPNTVIKWPLSRLPLLGCFLWSLLGKHFCFSFGSVLFSWAQLSWWANCSYLSCYYISGTLMGKKENKTIIILNLFQVKITQDYMGHFQTNEKWATIFYNLPWLGKQDVIHSIVRTPVSFIQSFHSVIQLKSEKQQIMLRTQKKDNNNLVIKYNSLGLLNSS